jgi:hypothetical protein
MPREQPVTNAVFEDKENNSDPFIIAEQFNKQLRF